MAPIECRPVLLKIHKLAHVPDFTAGLRHRYGNRFLMDVHAHVLAKLVHDLPPQLWLGAVGLTLLKPNPRR